MDNSTAPQGQFNSVTGNTGNNESLLDHFPPEIRLLIFEAAILDSLVDPPCLLAALQGNSDPKFHIEAIEVYGYVYRSINASNAAAFQRESLLERLKIKHLDIEGPVNFRGHMILLMNNTQVLTVDYSRTASTAHRPDNEGLQPGVGQAQSVVPLLIKVSKQRGKTQLRKIVLKCQEGLTINYDGVIERDQSVILDNLSEGLGADPEKNGTLDGGMLYWIWEAKEGESLIWTSPK